jgi:hypothetical protein
MLIPSATAAVPVPIPAFAPVERMLVVLAEGVVVGVCVRVGAAMDVTVVVGVRVMLFGSNKLPEKNQSAS